MNFKVENSNIVIKLRGHHLVCLSNFIGMGYSTEFINNMCKIKNFLKANLKLKCIKIVSGFDDLCEFCPNRFEEGSSFNFEGCNFHSCLKRDLAFLNLFNLKVGGFVSFEQVLIKTKSLVSNEVFANFCKSCRWFSLCVSVRSKSGFYNI